MSISIVTNFKTFFLSSCPSFFYEYINRIKSSPLAYRLTRGIFWSICGTVISRGLSLLAMVLVARMIGKERFGELGIIQSTIGMFGVFAGLGLGITTTKYVAEFREKNPSKAGRIIVLSNWVAIAAGTLMMFGLLITSPWLATHTLAAPHLSGLLQIGSLLILLGAVSGAQTGALSGFEAFKVIAKINFWAGIAAFPLIVAGAKIAGLNGIVWGMVLSLFVNWILNRSALRREIANNGIPLALSQWKEEVNILWNYSLPALLGGIVVGPVTWACYAILVNQPNGYAEMGIFNAANQWFLTIMFLPGVLCQAMLPVLSERLGFKDKTGSSRIINLSIKLNAGVVLPIVLIGCLLSPLIMSIYGAGFSDSWPVLVVVLSTAGLLAIQAPVGAFVQASGRMWLGASMNFGWGIVFLIGTFLFLNFGSLGLSIARALAYVLHGSWTFVFAFYIFKKNYHPLC